MHIEPMSISIDEDLLSDLRSRIRATRWPDAAPGEAWHQGTDLAYLKGLLDYWAGQFDWRAQERRLNEFHHFRADVDGSRVHFVHERALRPGGIPLILTHGWPSSFVEFLPLVPLLTDPQGHGIDGPAFDVVIPSLPGYGFSERPARTGVTTRSTARRWHALMRGLGYERYGAQGADFGAGRNHLYGPGSPRTDARHSSEHCGGAAVYRSGITAAVGGRAPVRRPESAMV